MDLVKFQQDLVVASEEYDKIFYVFDIESSSEDDEYDAHIPDITKSMLNFKLSNVLKYFFREDRQFDFESIINLKENDEFIINSKNKFKKREYRQIIKDCLEDFEKFTLWGLINVDKYVYDLHFISTRNGSSGDISIPDYRFNLVKPKIKKYVKKLLLEFKENEPQYSEKYDNILNIIDKKYKSESKNISFDSTASLS